MTIRGWRPWLLISLFLGTGLCTGQESNLSQIPSNIPGNSSTTDSNAPSPALSGQVVDSVTGQPIPRALVESGNGSGTFTDHEGHFTLEHAIVPFAQKPGYFAGPPGRPATDGSWLFKLTPEAILYGTVTDENSQPVQRLPIQLRRLDVRYGLAYWQDTNATTTNTEGQFRFAELSAGTYSISTGFMIDGLADARSSLGFVPILYPAPGLETADSPQDHAVAGIELKPGDHVEANLRPPQEKLYPVSGTIRGPYDRGANFSVETLDHLALAPAVRMMPDATFRLRLPLGSYRIQATTVVRDEMFSGTREINVGAAGLEAVAIDLSAHVTLPVELDYERGSNTQSPAEISFVNLMLIDQDPANHLSTFVSQPRRHQNGPSNPGDPMMIYGVPPGRYLLHANLAPPWYVASATCGSLDLVHDLLVVGEGSGACSLHVVLRDDSASLRFTVTTSQQHAITITAYPLGDLVQEPPGSHQAFGAPGGPITGTLSGLAPGRYLVIASNPRLEVPYREQKALEKYSAWGKEITLGANDDKEIELNPVPGEP